MNDKQTASTPYRFIANLADLVNVIPQDSIVSQTLIKNSAVNTVLFAFDAGQALSEHTSTSTALIHILDGEATVGLGEDQYDAKAGAWVYMEPRLAHSITAKTPLKMLLIMLPNKG